jgi:hypothetical protein
MEGWKKLAENNWNAPVDFLETERLTLYYGTSPNINIVWLRHYFKSILPINFRVSVLVNMAFDRAHMESKVENNEERSRILLFQGIKLVVAMTERQRGKALFGHVAFIAKQFSKRTKSPVEAKKLYGHAAALFLTLDRVIDAVRCHQAVANLPISDEEKITALENSLIALTGVVWPSHHEYIVAARLGVVIRNKMSKLRNRGLVIDSKLSNVQDGYELFEFTPPTTANSDPSLANVDPIHMNLKESKDE